MAAHNRRELTVRSLRSLTLAHDAFDLTVVLLDDGSTDGTAEAVKACWPGAIVLSGDGNAFWNGGMHQAWTYALGLDVDGYLWLNDDVQLDDDALSRLANEWAAQGGHEYPFILVGATRSQSGEVSYGGQVVASHPLALRFKRLPAADVLLEAYTFNGNIVLVSKATQQKIGINDKKFLHTLGDIDYGLRASRAGIPVLILPKTLGVCEPNKPMNYNTGNILNRIRNITSYRGIPMRNWIRITWRYSGIYMPLHFILPYRKIFFR